MYHSRAPGDQMFIADSSGANAVTLLAAGPPDDHRHYQVWSQDGRWILLRSRAAGDAGNGSVAHPIGRRPAGAVDPPEHRSGFPNADRRAHDSLRRTRRERGRTVAVGPRFAKPGVSASELGVGTVHGGCGELGWPEAGGECRQFHRRPLDRADSRRHGHRVRREAVSVTHGARAGAALRWRIAVLPVVPGRRRWAVGLSRRAGGGDSEGLGRRAAVSASGGTDGKTVAVALRREQQDPLAPARCGRHAAASARRRSRRSRLVVLVARWSVDRYGRQRRLRSRALQDSGGRRPAGSSQRRARRWIRSGLPRGT